MPIRSNERRTFALVAALAATSGCAGREYLTAPVLDEIEKRDPQLALVRVYPSTKFVSFYERQVGRDFAVDGSVGEVQTAYRAQRVEIPFAKNVPGAIVATGVYGGMPILWVTFDPRCTDERCALGFVLTHDQLFRLVQVPELSGFSQPSVYRRRVAERQRMERSRLFAKQKGVPVYLTTHGVSVSVALEIKKHNNVEIETVVVPQNGVPARMPPPSTPPATSASR
jgi:hypothetical protein